MFRFAVNAFAALCCLWGAILADDVPWFMRLFLGTIALGCGLAAAVQLPSVRRLADRDTKAP